MHFITAHIKTLNNLHGYLTGHGDDWDERTELAGKLEDMICDLEDYEQVIKDQSVDGFSGRRKK